MNWSSTQREFAAALREPEAKTPHGVAGAKGSAPSTRRFNVYRNNTMVSLVEALAATYPVVKELVGEEFFHALARAYAAENLPKSPVMLAYGSTFPDFLDAFEPARAVPFLADVSRVEWAWLEAYHAADSDPAELSVLAELSPSDVLLARIKFHPSLRLLESNWPAAAIWGAHQLSDNAARTASLESIFQTEKSNTEYAFVVRPGYDVDVRVLVPGIWTFLMALLARQTLGEALESLGGDDQENLVAMLTYLFEAGVVSGIEMPGSRG